MTACALSSIIERVETLPALPATVLRLMNVVSDPESSIPQIVDVIRYDPSLTAEVLRLCNSAYLGLARSVESLDDAVSLLGTVKVFQLVMNAHARGMLGKPQEGYGLPAEALWNHSMAVAAGAQLMARRMGLAQEDMLFTAGLLHDIGKIILNEFVGRDYAEIVRRVNDDGASFSEAELQVLGFTHAEVGARLAETWGLPEHIALCIQYHHEPRALPKIDPEVDAVYLADSVALLLGIGVGDDGLAYRATPEVLEHHGLVEADLENIGLDMVGELQSARALLAKR